jgi:competence protein ComEA
VGTNEEKQKGIAGALGRVAAAVRASAWAPLVGKGLGAVVAFVALALVGSGAVGGAFLRGGAAYGAPAPVGSTAAPIEVAPAARALGEPDAVAAGAVDGGAPAADAGADGGAAAGVTPDGKVILNLATEEELCRLPGIGKVRARGILELRARLGKFRRLEELLRVRGLGRRSFTRLRPLVLVDPPS